MNRDLILWTAIAGGPVAWMLSFGANWSIAWWACIWQWTPGQFVISVVAMLISLACAYVAWREWRQVGAATPGEAGGAIPRTRALAIGGMMLSAGSFLLMLSQTLVTILMGACQ